MKIAVFDTTDEVKRYNEFLDNMTVKHTDHGLYIETKASTITGSCTYGQAYSKDPNATTYAKDVKEAKQRFVNFYWPNRCFCFRRWHNRSDNAPRIYRGYKTIRRRNH